MNKKRAVAVSVTTVLLTLLSSPAAHALRRDDGDDPGTGLSVAETLGLFVAAPLLLFAAIAAAVILSERR
ncbi:hypothetical protein [Streptomyces triticirhizae]|uniref:Uncharacterized protein n=1 Tax=Streptomyces triticirhizae TaxID=2483353 RepID=A0A3M2LAR3_9ACTN|nr:hypothetical protein [Streptomyces triticirhizae]RMI34682.1 hypothetical protein EBN88_23340 [Streptomyces triticirhizae]